jgi:hypothetical protein
MASIDAVPYHAEFLIPLPPDVTELCLEMSSLTELSDDPIAFLPSFAERMTRLGSQLGLLVDLSTQRNSLFGTYNPSTLAVCSDQMHYAEMNEDDEPIRLSFNKNTSGNLDIVRIDNFDVEIRNLSEYTDRENKDLLEMHTIYYAGPFIRVHNTSHSSDYWYPESL